MATRGDQIIDSAVMMVTMTVERYGRQHIPMCGMGVSPVYTSREDPPQEPARHRELECWPACSQIPQASIGIADRLVADGHWHVEPDCMPRCAAMQELLRRACALGGVTYPELIALAARTIKRRKFIASDDRKGRK